MLAMFCSVFTSFVLAGECSLFLLEASLFCLEFEGKQMASARSGSSHANRRGSRIGARTDLAWGRCVSLGGKARTVK